MANIDVSDLLLDPDFTDLVTLIRRSCVVDAKGRNAMTETPVVPMITVCVQNVDTETLEKYPDLALLSDKISVWYKGVLTAESVNGYSDVIVFGSNRYYVKYVDEDYTNFGQGWTKAVCVLEKVNNNA